MQQILELRHGMLIFEIDYGIVECEEYIKLGVLQAAFRGLVFNLLTVCSLTYRDSKQVNAKVAIFISLFTSAQLLRKFLIQRHFRSSDDA